MLDMTVNAEVAKVLGALDGALSSGDIDRAVSLFQTDCYWRDLVTFTWNIRTMEGHDQIRDMLTAQLGTVSGAAEVLEENPLPWVLLVSPEEAGDAGRLDRRVDLLLQELLGLEAVASAQYDRKWLERLARLLELGGAVALVLTILFGLAVTVVVANTIRLDVAARADVHLRHPARLLVPGPAQRDHVVPDVDARAFQRRPPERFAADVDPPAGAREDRQSRRDAGDPEPVRPALHQVLPAARLRRRHEGQPATLRLLHQGQGTLGRPDGLTQQERRRA